MKNTKLASIKIKGNDYVKVNTRVSHFNETYPNGSIITEIVEIDTKHILIKATVTPDVSKPERYFTGHALEEKDSSFINKTSHVENAETSAWGRALAALGIGIDAEMCSAEELVNAISNQNKKTYPSPNTVNLDKEMGELRNEPIPFITNYDLCPICEKKKNSKWDTCWDCKS